MVGVDHHQSAVPRHNVLILRAGVGEHFLPQRAVDPLEHRHAATRAGVRRRPSFRSCGVAGLLLFRNDEIRHPTVPGPQVDFMHVAIVGADSVRDPRHVRIIRLLIPGDSSLIGCATLSFVLIGGGDDIILRRGERSRSEAVADVAGTDVVAGPVRGSRVAALQARILVPVNASTLIGAYQVRRGIRADVNDGNTVSRAGDVIHNLPVVAIVLKRHELCCAQADRSGADHIDLAILIDVG